MDAAPWVERYSIYSAVEEVRQVFYNSGGYTPMGAMYRDHVSPIAYQQIIPGEGMRPVADYTFEDGVVGPFRAAGTTRSVMIIRTMASGMTGGGPFSLTVWMTILFCLTVLSDSLDFTFAAWINWNGGAAWQRIFDFGVMSSREYMFSDAHDFIRPGEPSAVRDPERRTRSSC